MAMANSIYFLSLELIFIIIVLLSHLQFNPALLNSTSTICFVFSSSLLNHLCLSVYSLILRCLILLLSQSNLHCSLIYSPILYSIKIFDPDGHVK